MGKQTVAFIDSEVRAAMEKMHIVGRIPTSAEFRQGGYDELIAKIYQNGGFRLLQKRLDLPRKTKHADNDEDVEQVFNAIRALMHELNIVHLPSSTQILAHSSQLHYRVLKFGGIEWLEDRMHISRGPRRTVTPKAVPVPKVYVIKPPRYWHDITNVETELRQVMDDLGIIDRLPTRAELRAAKQTTLSAALYQFGRSTLEHRIGLDAGQLPHWPKNHWQTIANIDNEVCHIMAALGLADRLPSYTQIVEHAGASLATAISMHGGRIVVAERLGVLS